MYPPINSQVIYSSNSPFSQVRQFAVRLTMGCSARVLTMGSAPALRLAVVLGVTYDPDSLHAKVIGGDSTFEGSLRGPDVSGRGLNPSAEEACAGDAGGLRAP